MKSAKRALLVVAFSALVGCSSPDNSLNTPAEVVPPPPLKIYATTATTPLLHDLTTAYSTTFSLPFETRTGNYQTLLEFIQTGDNLYFMTTHQPPSESGLWVAPIALDALSVIVHPDNPVTNLTTDQLRDIYQGRVSNWSQVGGDNRPLIPISREDGSATRAEFEAQVMGIRRTTRSAMIASSSAEMLALVAETPNGIGYLSPAYLSASVRALTVNGLSPTAHTIAENLYPLRTTVYIVGLNPPDGASKDFILWVQSPQGQQVVSQRYTSLIRFPTLER